MSTERQIAANRANGLLGGVKTPEGKAISRLNARKHGIFASALTENDAVELRGVEDEMIAELAPVGIIEEILVEKLALTYLRLQRCARAEARHYREMWTEGSAVFVRDKREKRIAAIGLYDVRLTNQFLRLLAELERRRKARAADAQRSEPRAQPLPPEVAEKTQNEPNSPPRAAPQAAPADVQNEPKLTPDAPTNAAFSESPSLRVTASPRLRVSVANAPEPASALALKNEPISRGAP